MSLIICLKDKCACGEGTREYAIRTMSFKGIFRLDLFNFLKVVRELVLTK